MDSAYFCGFCFQNLDALYRPVAGKPLVLEDRGFMFGHGHFCGICPNCWNHFWNYEMYVWYVDMRGRVRMWSKFEIFRFFKSGYAHDRNISIFRRRASRVTGSTLIKPNYASVRQSRDSLHRDTHKVTKKVAAAPCSETAWAKKLKKFTETCFRHTTMPVNLV